MVSGLSQEVRFLDLTPVLRTKAQAGVLPYFSDDSHLNEVGHEVVAEALAEFVSR